MYVLHKVRVTTKIILETILFSVRSEKQTEEERDKKNKPRQREERKWGYEVRLDTRLVKWGQWRPQNETSERCYTQACLSTVQSSAWFKPGLCLIWHTYYLRICTQTELSTAYTIPNLLQEMLDNATCGLRYRFLPWIQGNTSMTKFSRANQCGSVNRLWLVQWLWFCHNETAERQFTVHSSSVKTALKIDHSRIGRVNSLLGRSYVDNNYIIG